VNNRPQGIEKRSSCASSPSASDGWRGTALLAGLDPKDRAQRDQTIRAAHLEHGYTLAEIAAGPGLRYSTISKAIDAPSG
jgi:hypothetical protein